MQLADIGGYIEQERKPTDPVEELHFADFADLWGKTLCGGKDLAEEGDDAFAFVARRTFEAWVALADVEG